MGPPNRDTALYNTILDIITSSIYILYLYILHVTIYRYTNKYFYIFILPKLIISQRYSRSTLNLSRIP